MVDRGYRVPTGAFVTGRPDRPTVALESPSGERLVAKLYPPGAGEGTFESMQALWASRFGEARRPPGLPRPHEYIGELAAVIMERLEGRPLIELQGAGEGRVEDAMELLSDLHGSEATPTQRRDAARIVRSVRRKAARVEVLAPHVAPAYTEAVDALAAPRPEAAELVPSHGDFSPRNVFDRPGGLALIDWDRFQLADPARDVANYGSWCWAWAHRRGDRPSWTPLRSALAAYGSLRPSSSIEERLDWHVAACLLRTAHSILELWPEETPAVPFLVEEARRRLT